MRICSQLLSKQYSLICISTHYQIVFKINVLLLSLLLIKIRYFHHRNVNSFLVYFIYFLNSCLYGGRAPKGELCNKVYLFKGQDTESTNVRKAYSKWGTQSFWLELCWRLFTVLMQALKSIFRY